MRSLRTSAGKDEKYAHWLRTFSESAHSGSAQRRGTSRQSFYVCCAHTDRVVQGMLVGWLLASWRCRLDSTPSFTTPPLLHFKAARAPKSLPSALLVVAVFLIGVPGGKEKGQQRVLVPDASATTWQSLSTAVGSSSELEDMSSMYVPPTSSHALLLPWIPPPSLHVLSLPCIPPLSSHA